ncbi:hypothetical protein D3C73_1402480 [compost metagenome]
MHGNNGFGSWGNSGFNRSGIDHQGIAVNIDHHWRRAEQLDHVEGRNPSLRWSNHFITRTDVQGHQGEVHTRSG